MADGRSPDPGAPRRGPTSLPERLLGSGARGARSLAGATGIDRAVETATEEAIVRALESPAVERALVRVLQGPAVEEAVEGALQSPAVERALVRTLDSEMVDRLWEQLLSSDEAQKLVERIAEAPEVRSAVAAQGVGLIEDVGRQIGRVARRLDDVIEGFVRRIRRRPRREERTNRAGFVTRALALMIDAGILNALFAAFSALLALVLNELLGGGDGVSGPALAVGAFAWLAGGAVYLVSFWSLAGQTPGMRFLGIHLDAAGERRIGARRARRRLWGTVLAALPLGAGFLGVLGERRRGLHDRIAGTLVVYADPRGPARGTTQV
jgi:uncharacterized RDD family membrane protein YckC